MGSLEIKDQDLLGDASFRLHGVSYLLGSLIESERNSGNQEASSAFYQIQIMVDESVAEIDQVINECS